jgi:hypothetical protein
MTDLSKQKILVIDRGQFLPVAERLSRDFGLVEYYLAEEDPEPQRHTEEIGKGYDNIKVIDDLHRAADRCDAMAFLDVNNSDTPTWFYDKGYNVYSALKSEPIETDKKFLKKVLAKLGLPVIPTQYVTGLTNAQRILKNQEDKWIKPRWYRGDIETQHYTNEFLMSTWFDAKRAEVLTPETIDLMIEDAIEAICEGGFDTPMLHGDIPQWLLMGYEAKDSGYFARVTKKLPPILAKIHDAMKPIFKKLGYQGWYSCEMRIKSHDEIFYNDATCRPGSPPSELYCEMYDNFPETVWMLAHGEMPTLKPRAIYGAQITLTSDFNEKHTLPVQLPTEIDQWFKPKNAKKVKEGYLIIPNHNCGYIGSVIAYDNDPKRAQELCLERAGMIKGEQIDFNKYVFDEINETVEKGKQVGLIF